MISFCKNIVYSLFTYITFYTTTLITYITSTTTLTPQQQTQPSAVPGLRILTTNHDDIPKPNNVIHSTSLLITAGLQKIKEAVAPVPKQDRIEIRERRALGGGDADDRLATCTESLGFEGCNERTMSCDELHKHMIDYYEKVRAQRKSKFAEKMKEKEATRMRVKVFPPPLTTLNDNGKRVFSFKHERKDGRLTLTLVQLFRNESLHACREDGRLRILLVKKTLLKKDCDINVGTSEDKLGGTKVAEDSTKDNLGDTKCKKVDVEKQKFPENCSGGDDCRWLTEMVGSHHHHHPNMHGWGQQSVTIR